LVTNAHTWIQQASRAFAAELLAPINALRARVPREVEARNYVTLVDELASHFEVSSRVIEHQLENAEIKPIVS
jgi:Zn-dependent peptidase ImmA (M78 family)